MIDSESRGSKWARTTIKAVRTSANRICECVGKQKEPNERKTPDTTLIYEIIGIGWGSRLSHLQLIIACGQAMGVSHPLFDAHKEWDQLKFPRWTT